MRIKWYKTYTNIDMLGIDVDTFDKDYGEYMGVLTLHLNFYPISRWIRRCMWYYHNGVYDLSINTPWIELRVDKWWRY
jgi:hypothetical protein